MCNIIEVVIRYIIQSPAPRISKTYTKKENEIPDAQANDQNENTGDDFLDLADFSSIMCT